MAKLTKSQLMATLAEAIGVSKKDAQNFVDKLVALAYSHTKSDGEFTIPGLGKLVKKHRAARMGRNPATGEQIKIKASKKLAFRAAKEVKESI